MKKFSMKFIAGLLSVLLVIMSLPVSAFAIDLSGDSSPPAEDEIIYNRDIVELVDMRTATDKYFRLDDGSYYVAHYNSDVHYLDDNGVWQDIDNSLAVNGSEITTSDAKIKLAKKTTGNGEIFTIHDGNRKLSLALNGANKKVEGIISNNEAEFDDDATQLQKMTTLDKISASVRYNDILENVDLEYVIKGANIKENIIVKAKASNYSYSFTLSLNNLVASLNEKNEIIISDSSTSEIVYLIPAPIMWDANDVYSDDIAVSLTDNNNGKYTLTITADSDWMNATDRVYPITIDPPIYTSSSSSVLDLDFYSQSAPFQDSLELMKLDGSLRGLPSSAAGEFVNRFKNAKEFLSMTTSKSSFVISYGFAAIAVGNTIYSCFTSDPVARAESLGYALK